MTVHAAKGLEFPVVFIGGMEENLFPSQFCVKPGEIEEERRLLYVAITRAMERCYLSYARQRFRNGQMAFNSPSRFLNDIDRQYLDLARPPYGLQEQRPSYGLTEHRPATPDRTQTYNPSLNQSVSPQGGLSAKRSVSVSGLSGEAGLYSPGDRVSHRVFGEGTVVRVYRDEVTENDKIEINFDTQGTKTLLLTHAKLEKI